MGQVSRRARPLRLCLIGSAYWSRHLAELLRRESARVTVVGTYTGRQLFFHPEFNSGCDLVLRVGFPPVRHSAKFRIFEQMFDVLTRLRRTTVVLYWIGSDIQLALNAHRKGRLWPGAMRRLRRCRHLVGAPWFREALSELGLDGEVVVFPTTFPRWEGPLTLPRDFTVLSYVLPGNEDLYGFGMIVELARRFPHVSFVIMGHPGLPTKLPDNIRFAGHLPDPHPALRACTVVLRLTRTDAIGGTVREGLFWGRHVICTHPVPHTRLVKYSDVDEAERHLRDLMEAHAAGELDLNLAGRDYALREFDADRAVSTLVEKLHSLLPPSASEYRR